MSILGNLLRRTAPAVVALALGAAGARAEDGGHDLAAFSREMRDSATRVRSLREETDQGRNVSEFSMGLFALRLLNRLAGQDSELAEHIHADQRSTEEYLGDVFRAHPAEEVSAMRRLAQGSHRTLRLAAEHVLEALQHIPEDDESAAQQAGARQRLAAELAALESLLQQAAAEAADGRHP